MSALLAAMERLMSWLFESAVESDARVLEDAATRRAALLARQERVMQRLRTIGIDLHALDAEVKATRRDPIHGDRHGGRLHDS